MIAATDAFCLIDIYRFLCGHSSLSAYVQSFRGKKPRRLDAIVNRQIEKNVHDSDDMTVDTTTTSTTSFQVGYTEHVQHAEQH
jgi:hypothetical protein